MRSPPRAVPGRAVAAVRPHLLGRRPRDLNDTFAAIFEDRVKAALARLPVRRDPSSRVREVARAALGSGACTLEGTARAMGLGARTLQRRLQEEGTSFAAVIDALRREMAVAYLERGIPAPEVAELLGYSDVTAFHHAFSRWTGSSPARFSTGCSNEGVPGGAGGSRTALED